ncbi:MAG TPA: response regulator transcription factor [Myxococcaceae bacterium]|nr:response regulator transcription factor [Myxococcaceae bacterium]
MTTEHGGSVRVSLLDGQILRGDALARVLSESGHVIVGRHARADAFLSSLAQEQPQIAVVDVALANGEGVVALAEARQFHPNLQVLAVGDGPDALDRCIAAGAAAYLDARTSVCDDVLHTLELLARGERAVSAHMLGAAFQATRAPEHEQLRPLSARERQVLAWVSAGADNGDIAQSLQITERTVKAHVSSLYRKLRQDNRTQLALLARQLGVRPPSS